MGTSFKLDADAYAGCKVTQKSGSVKEPAEQVVHNIRRATRKRYSAEEKIRIVPEGLRGWESFPCSGAIRDSGSIWSVDNLRAWMSDNGAFIPGTRMRHVKLYKAGFRSNNIDPNARHCMASAVAGFIRTFGIDEPMGCYDDLEHADGFVL